MLIFWAWIVEHSTILPTMVNVTIVNKTSPEANWNRQEGRQADTQDHILSQADALTKNGIDRVLYFFCPGL